MKYLKNVWTWIIGAFLVIYSLFRYNKGAKEALQSKLKNIKAENDSNKLDIHKEYLNKEKEELKGKEKEIKEKALNDIKNLDSRTNEEIIDFWKKN